MAIKRVIGKTIYPRPHANNHQFKLSLVDSGQQATIYPLVMNDDALGAPSGYNAHPEHSSFAQTSEAHCYNESKVNKINADFLLSLTKHCWNTDKIEELRILVIPIMMSYDDGTVIDEKTSVEIQDVLETQEEDTDLQ